MEWNYTKKKFDSSISEKCFRDIQVIDTLDADTYGTETKAAARRH